MRTARIKGEPGSFYHCMSRIIERRPLLGELEKEKFRRVLRDCEDFCGLRVVTYALMDNHFHILVQVPAQPELSEREFLRRLGRLYEKPLVEDIARQLRKLRAKGTERAAAEAARIRAKYTRRMGEISEFVKTLKQRFTQWYNRRHERHGTLWEQRFKSVLVEGGFHTLATMAAYIDLNPVRAGMVKDPKDYRYCGYAEALGGHALAQAGLGLVLESLEQPDDWASVRGQYRKYLFASGEKTESRGGFSAEHVRQVLNEGGELSASELLRCRVRYFTDGAVLGSRAFVEQVFHAHRGFFGAHRQSGARPMKGGDWGGLCTARDLRLEVVTLPATG